MEGSGRIILVEGYMDVISVYQAGVTNIAATRNSDNPRSGEAFTALLLRDTFMLRQ